MTTMPPCSECLIRSCVTSRTNIKMYCTPAGLTSFLVWTVFHKHGNGYHSELRAARFQSQQHPPHLDCNVFFCFLNLQSMDVDSGGKMDFSRFEDFCLENRSWFLERDMRADFSTAYFTTDLKKCIHLIFGRKSFSLVGWQVLISHKLH